MVRMDTKRGCSIGTTSTLITHSAIDLSALIQRAELVLRLQSIMKDACEGSRASTICGAAGKAGVEL